jgi:hypothetical protein
MDAPEGFLPVTVTIYCVPGAKPESVAELNLTPSSEITTLGIGFPEVSVIVYV